MTDSNLTIETTARVGEHTATVRVLDTGAVKLTPRMAAQLDSIRLDALDAFGRISVYRYNVSSVSEYRSGSYGYADVLIGRNTDGDLAIGELPNPTVLPGLGAPRDAPRPRLGTEPPGMFGTSAWTPEAVTFEGRKCFINLFDCEEVTDGSLAVGEFDPNGNEDTFREQIAEHSRVVALREELLDLPRILLPED